MALRDHGLWCELALAAVVRCAAEWRGLRPGAVGWVLVLRGHLMGGDGPRALRFGPGQAVAVEVAGRLAGVAAPRTSADFQGLVLVFAPGLGASHARYLVDHYGKRVCFSPGAAVVRAGSALVRGGARSGWAQAVRAVEWLAQWHEHLEARLTRLRAGLARAVTPEGRRALAAYSLKELAETTAWSRASLVRRLRQAGLPRPAEGLRTERLRWAAERLRHGRENIAAIMTQVGYRSLTGFAAAFRREFGCAPGDVRDGAAAGAAFAPPSVPGQGPAAPAHRRGPHPDQEAERLHPWAFGLSSAGTSGQRPTSPFRLDLGAAVAKTTWLVTLAGEAALRYAGGEYAVRRGIAVTYPQPTAAEWRAVGSGARARWRRVWVQMHGVAAARFVAAVAAHAGEVQTLDPEGRAVRAAQALLQRMRQGGSWSWLRRSAAVYRWLMAWASEVEQRGGAARVGNLGLVPLACAQANRRFTAYATALGYSRSYLQRKLRTQWQLPPGHVLRVTRLKAAAAQLQMSRKPVAEIAKEAGYDTGWGFTAAFKRQYGVTPLRFRHGVGPAGEARR